MNPVESALQPALDAHRRGDWPRAEMLCREFLRAAPESLNALNLLGGALARQGKFAEALDAYDRVLARAPSPEIHYNRGNALKGLGRVEDALESYALALALRPDYAEALNNGGLLLEEHRRFEPALAAYERALALRPLHAGTHYNRANVLLALGRAEEAVASYDRGLALRPDYAEACNNRGQALKALGRHALALASFQQAVKLRVDFAEAHYNVGNQLLHFGNFEGALESLHRAQALAPETDWLAGYRGYAKLRLCDWRGLEAEVPALIERMNAGRKVIPPFVALALLDDPALQRRAAEVWVKAKHPGRSSAAFPPRAAGKRLRVGYFSADFRNHPVSALLAEVLEMHDRSRFEITAFSFGPDTEDPMRLRIERAVERFLDVRAESDAQIVARARELELDLAIDLGGFTEGGRPDLFARRVAPLQLSYLGYLGTLAAPYMDYLIADPVLIPPELRTHYTERILYLPWYQANDSKRLIAPETRSRREFGLPERGTVFCCFNASYKLTPATFARWMRILKSVQGSVLWLLAETPTVEANLRAAAAQHSIDPQRLVFGTRLPMPEYLARYRVADLFLDTLPYNAGTTGSDALYAGLPLLTLCGNSFPARMGASLLTALGLPELITYSEADYERTAIALATHPMRLADLKTRLHEARHSAPLFDTATFTAHLEAAYRTLYARYLEGRPNEDLVPPA
jgi:predicted O-linked N-acetylglucosamine transferase (SPINDLY family)